MEMFWLINLMKLSESIGEGRMTAMHFVQKDEIHLKNDKTKL